MNTNKSDARKTIRIPSMLLLSLLVLGNTACGIKPSAVESPGGKEQDVYPRAYPATQPQNTSQ